MRDLTGASGVEDVSRPRRVHLDGSLDIREPCRLVHLLTFGPQLASLDEAGNSERPEDRDQRRQADREDQAYEAITTFVCPTLKMPLCSFRIVDHGAKYITANG